MNLKAAFPVREEKMLSTHKHQWLSGKIRARAPCTGSIPCRFDVSFLVSPVHSRLVATRADQGEGVSGGVSVY